MNEGYTTYTCSCGDSYVSDIVDLLGHTFSEWKIIGAATTPETETAERVCSICNTRETKTLAHNHNYTSTITLTALCNREGVKKYSCASCGNTYTEAIPKLSPDGSHTYNEGQIISSPTCASNGKMKYTCIHGDMYYYETIPATGKHDYSKVEVISKVRCDSDGFQKVRCANCYDWYQERIPALGHDYDSGVVTAEAHCLWEGEITFTCSRCSSTYTESIPKLTHDYDDGIVTRESTCTDAGIIVYTCTICGDTDQRAIQKLEHNYVSGKCTGCGRINNTKVP